MGRVTPSRGTPPRPVPHLRNVHGAQPLGKTPHPSGGTQEQASISRGTTFACRTGTTTDAALPCPTYPRRLHTHPQPLRPRQLLQARTSGDGPHPGARARPTHTTSTLLSFGTKVISRLTNHRTSVPTHLPTRPLYRHLRRAVVLCHLERHSAPRIPTPDHHHGNHGLPLVIPTTTTDHPRANPRSPFHTREGCDSTPLATNGSHYINGSRSPPTAT